MQATVTLLFLGGIDVVDVGLSPFWQEESRVLHLAGLDLPQW